MMSRALVAALAALSLGVRVAADSQVLFPQCPAEGACGDNEYVDIKSELGWALSEGAEIILQQDQSFTSQTVRWSTYSPPSFRAVVQVTCEQDVQAVVSIP